MARRFSINARQALDHLDWQTRAADASEWERNEERKRLTHAPIFQGEKLERLIEQIKSILKAGRDSDFQHEAAARHGIRSALCLQGHSWQRADGEAAILVRHALRLLGAVRPSWDQGQDWYARGEGNCRRCRHPITDDSPKPVARQGFCSNVCLLSVHRYGMHPPDYHGSTAWDLAHFLIRKSRMPLRSCVNCGESFRPATFEAVTCSPKCAGKVRKDAVPEKDCAQCGKRFRGRSAESKFCCTQCQADHQRLPEIPCANCGKPFQPPNATRKYCGRSCYFEHSRAVRPNRPCDHCGQQFQPKAANQTYCGVRCRTAAEAEKRKHRKRKAA